MYRPGYAAQRWPLEADGGENYLGSVSDLMAGLVFFFILTLLVFALTFEGATGEVTDALQVRDEILQQLQSILEREGVQVQIDSEQGVLRLPEAILFPSGSADLRPEGERALGVLARGLTQILPCYTGNPEGVRPSTCQGPDRRGKLDAVFIEGHTDNLPIRNALFPDNWALATARAIRTYQTLVAMEPRLDRLRNYAGQPVFTVSGYADRRPVASNQTETGRQQNRRIDVRLIMATPSLSDVLTREVFPDPAVQGAERDGR